MKGKLNPKSNIDTMSFFGKSIALNMEGTIAVVSTYDEKKVHTEEESEVIVLNKIEGEWIKVQSLNCPSENKASFGERLTISGDGNTIVASLNTYTDPDKDIGRAFVYRVFHGRWEFVHELKVVDDNDGVYFNDISISNDGSTIVIGAISNISKVVVPGKVYVFSEYLNVWKQSAILTGNNKGYFTKYGFATSMSDDGRILLVSNCTTNTNYSVVSLYNRRINTWESELDIIPTMRGNGIIFGRTIAISGDGKLVCTAESIMNKHNVLNALLQFYERAGDTWISMSILELDKSETYNTVVTGLSISKSNAKLAVGLRKYGEKKMHEDEIHVYSRQGDKWNHEGIISVYDLEVDGTYNDIIKVSTNGVLLDPA